MAQSAGHGDFRAGQLWRTGGWQAGAWVFAACGIGAMTFAAAIWRAEARLAPSIR